LIQSSSSSCPLTVTVGIINATSLGRSEQPPQSTGPLLQQSCVVSALIAPTTRSASLDDSRRLPSMAGYTTSLCPTTWSGLSPRPSLLCDNAPSIRATTPTPGGGVSAYFRSFLTPQGLPQSNNGSAPPSIPTPVSVGGNCRRCSVRFMLRPAWLLAFLDWSDLTSPSAAEDVYARACPRDDHSPPESGMTTQHHRIDTVAGLPPAGALPLQAARYSVPHSHCLNL
jgi:hypothetical protein